MGDVSFELGGELLRTRDTQFAAQPTQALDNTTLLVAEIRRVRNLDAVSTPLDTMTELEQNWDGSRAT